MKGEFYMNSDQNNIPAFIEPERTVNNTFSVLSMSFGIAAISIYFFIALLFSLSFFIWFFLFGFLGCTGSTICSILALYFYRRARVQNQRNGMATCGLVCGITSLSLWLLTILSLAWLIFLLITTSPSPV